MKRKHIQNVQKENTHYSSKIVPYFFDKGKLLILLGLDAKYQEFSPLGGGCDKQNETAAKCLLRELNEESRELLNLDELFDLSKCKAMRYTTKIYSNRFGEMNINTTIFFIEWIGPKRDKNYVLDLFVDKDRNMKLKEEKGINSRPYFEMESLKLIQVNSEAFQEYLINTFKDQTLRLKQRGDTVFRDNLLSRYQSLFNLYKINYIDEKTDAKRFDVEFIGGLIEGLSEYFDKTYYSVVEIIADFIIFLMDTEGRCYSSFK